MERNIEIIIVEDEKRELNELIDQIYAHEDLKFIASSNSSKDAINKIMELLPDILILDLELTKGSGSGIDVLATINNSDIPKKPYVIVTTINSSKITLETARQFGADYIISKNQDNYSAKAVVDFINTIKKTIHNINKEKFCSSYESPTQKNSRLKKAIEQELYNIGITANLTGHKYLTSAILLVINNNNNHMRNLPQEVANIYNKSRASVERAMTNAISRAWTRTCIDDLLKYYTTVINSQKGCPSLTEFIYYYANKLS